MATQVAEQPTLPAYRRLLVTVSENLDYIGIAFLFVMMLVSVVDVTGRLFLNMPLQGSYEIVQYCMVGTVFFCFGHIQILGGNISVEIVVDRLPTWAQDIVETFTTVVSIVLFVWITYASVLQIEQVYRTGSASGVLGIPDWPFQAVLTFGYLILTLVLITDLGLLIDDLRHGGRAGMKHQASTQI